MIKKLSVEEADKWKDQHLSLGNIRIMEGTSYTLIHIIQVIIRMFIFICIKGGIGSILIGIIEAITYIAMSRTVLIDLKTWQYREKLGNYGKIDIFLSIVIKLKTSIISTEMAT